MIIIHQNKIDIIYKEKIRGGELEPE